MHCLPLRTLTAAALLLAACSGDGGTSTGTTAETTSPSTTAPSTGDTPTTTPTSSDTSVTSTTGTAGTSSDATTAPATSDTGDTTQGVDATTTSDASTSTASASTSGDASTGSTGADASSGGESSSGGPVESDIEVVITADNAYAFAYGTDDSISKYYGGVEAVTAGQIFNCGEGPETYVIPYAETIGTTQLYIIAWADSAVTQGVLARFRRKGGGGGFGEDVFTGTKGWQVCATGFDYQPGNGGPPLAQINDFIGKCNEGKLDPNTTSVGWVDDIGTQYGAVAFGEDNTTPYDGGPKAGNEFPLVCQAVMPNEAHWMWFNWDPPNIKPPKSPFLWPGGGGNPDHQFLIFRLAAELLPDPQ